MVGEPAAASWVPRSADRPRLRANDHAGAPSSQRGATYSHRTVPAAEEAGAAGFQTPGNPQPAASPSPRRRNKARRAPGAIAPSLGTGRDGNTEQLSGRLDVPS